MTGAVLSADTEEARAAATRIAEARALVHQNEPELREFFDAIYAGAMAEDIQRTSPERLAALARALFQEAGRRKKGTITVALFDDGTETVLVAINDDRPFLFDSALQAALAGGARVRAAIHPILMLDGVRTSIIALVCDAVHGQMRTELTTALKEAFFQGALAVRDWRAMLARLKQAQKDLSLYSAIVEANSKLDIAEDIAFLDWLAADHFTFLGARDYLLTGDGPHGQLEPVKSSGLGVLCDEQTRVIRARGEQRSLTAEVRAYLDEPQPLIVTKSQVRSVVHRRAHMDYIGVKLFGANGLLRGEHRFVGLFTSSAYSAQPRAIPLLRLKIKDVMDRAGLAADSHDGKALSHVLDTFPRDELFQISADELFEISTGILRLGGLPRVKLYLRFDRFDRFVSAIVLAPAKHMSAQIREQIHAFLAESLNGRTSAFEAAIGEGAMVRLHFIVGRNRGPVPSVDVKALERHIAGLIETWDEALVRALCALHGRADGFAHYERRAPRFSAGYRSLFPAHEGARDLAVLEELSAQQEGLKLRARVWRKEGDSAQTLRLKLFVLGDVLPLSSSLPVFENFNLKVIAEDSFAVSFQVDNGWRQDAVVLDFLMEHVDGLPLKLDELRNSLEDAIHAVLHGQCENDGFNKLVIAANLFWRDVVILRAAAMFLRQAAMTFSLAYMQQALVRNAELAALLIGLFYARNDPLMETKSRDGLAGEIETRIDARLKDVPSLDDDRIIRRFKNVIDAVLRTNFWQRDDKGSPKTSLAMKFDSARLDELPPPRPWREIFVYSPSMEGVHLRFGPIARGGIRWSDRREDFRTEILGLVKAQQVKNSVIVPVGAKGGFYPKNIPANASREDALALGVCAYKTFINALLDLTDNLDAQGRLMSPADIVSHDGQDPYLVVAADKGTATFSDIANAIALARNFWLGDAFASGGSDGYDHKKMGITARGAWEAIKRHFRELGRDIQSEDFTVVGVGDMSGDVFGNGMLLSRHIRLIGAFDHRHIFLDPGADTAAAFQERQRLFALPRSSWDDYNKSLISDGGGVFARTLKEIDLSPEVQAMLGTTEQTLTPACLISALLKAKTDLLWFGGIGTYIKASSQSNLEVGDRANDMLRVNANEVQARVIAEGANLAVTQLGRIEYARQKNGRIDTDAVDNSAGVDTSDHEVNIKILLNGPLMRGELSPQQRNDFLAMLTEDVAKLVLADNYNQTLALSVAQLNARRDADAHARMIANLEARGKLDRAVEFLPSDATLKTLARNGVALTRPELCVLLAYAKLDLDSEILASDLPDDPALTAFLNSYFPPRAIQSFPQEPQRHRLKREIISTMLVNSIVNLAGPVFVQRMREISGQNGASVARAFVLADGAFGLSALKLQIDALDGRVASDVQNRLYAEISDHFRRVTPWFLSRVPAQAPLAATLGFYRAGVEMLRQKHALPGTDGNRGPELSQAQLPLELSREITSLGSLVPALDIAQLSHQSGKDAEGVAFLYFALGEQLGLERLRDLAAKLSPNDHWDRLALQQLLDNLSSAQCGLAGELLAGGIALKAWSEKNRDALSRTRDFMNALETSGELSVSKLMLATSKVQALV